MPNRILSAVCSVLLGVAIGVGAMFLWFAVDVLRFFPVGEDSPTALGFPLGFVLGIIAWWRFKELIVIHIISVAIGSIGSAFSFFKFVELGRLSTQTDGWIGLSYTLAYGVWLVIFIGFACMLLSGILSFVSRWRRVKKLAEQDAASDPSPSTALLPNR